MALPQSIDPSSLNLSGRPVIATDPTTTTSAVDLGMPNPTIGMEKNTVSPLLGSLFGGLLGYGYGQKNAGTTAGNTPTTGTPTGNTPSGPSGNLPTGTPTGNTGSVNNVKVPSSIPISEAQNWLNTNYGMTNGKPNFLVSGTNLSTGEVIGLPNDTIGGTNLGTNTGNFGFEAGTGSGGTTTGGTTTGGGTTTTPTDTTQTTNQYFQDSEGNVYDATGTLIYTNPSRPISGGTTGSAGTVSGGSSSSQSPQYLQDSAGNVYDEDGTLIYYNPSNAIPGTNDGGGGYDPSVPETEQYYEDSSGNIFDYSGNLVLEFGNGYYYEPDTGNFYDSNFDSVGNDFNAYQDFFNIPTYGGSDNYNYDFGDLGDYFDYGNYTSGSTTYIKDGGSVRGGLATPLFRNGGSVPRFDNGGFIDQVVANQVPQSVTSTGTTATTPVAMETQTNLTNPSTTSTTSTTGSILDSILGFAKNNPTVTGAGLGAILTALINSQTEQPVNRGVDMSALGTLKARTTPTGAARFVPYSEYGTPTTPYDYSQLYANLGVSPFGAGAGALSPSATPTSPVSAQPATTTPSVPTGGLPSITAPTAPSAPSAPQYFQDADGNVYNANGDLVYDTTTGTTTPTAQQAVAPSGTTQANVAPMSGLAVTTPEASSSYYSYGSNVDPAQILSSKKGGSISMADGGTPAYYSGTDVLEGDFSTYYKNLIGQYDPTGELGLTQQKLIQALQQSYPNMNQYEIDALVATKPDVAFSMYKDQLAQNNFARDYALKGTTSGPTDDPLATLYSSVGSSMDPSQYDYYYEPTAHYNLQGLDVTGQQIQDYFTQNKNAPLPYERNNVSTTSTPVNYYGGMPQQTQNLMPTQGTAMPTQGPAMPTQGPAMPTQGALMPTQGPAMPQQTPFSSSPTFRYSGTNNPLLTGLRQGPVQQPFMLMPNGTFAPREEISTSRLYGQYAEGGSPHGNANIPVTEGHNPNVPIVQGRQDYREGAYVQGEGDGQSDDIPAMLADGEYVIDAETVAQLGNGSNKAGAKMLDKFRENIRAHKRSAPTHKIPPKSKSPLAYLKGAK